MLFKLGALLLAAAFPALAANPFFAQGQDRFAAADQAFRERKDPARAMEALKLYRDFYRAAPNDPQAGWRVGIACYFVGIRLTTDKEERKKLYAEGRDAAVAAAKMDDGCAACHFWAAINTVLYGDAVGVFKMFFSLGGVKEQLKASIAHDPAYAYGGAYRLLGQIDQGLPRILGGSAKRARDYYGKAIAVAPDEPLNYLFMARLLDERLDDRVAALEAAKKGLEAPAPGPERLESVDALADLRAFVKERDPRN
jgi:tetratricopeptide (TPR) repeat protein